MATIVCQGLQSCLESQIVESRTLRLKLSSPKPHFSQSLELALKPCSLDSNTKELSEKHYDEEMNTSSIQNSDMGGWSFLQVLSDISESPKESSMEKEKNTYVHPQIKRYPSTLSEKSLELCTENLGSESGTEILDNSIFSLCSIESEVGNSPTREQQKSRQLLGAKKANCRNFPPPLTTMSGSESIQVRPHREDGRLVIEAVKAPSPHAYFQAERSHGRLRLCFVKDSASNFDSSGVVDSRGENEETENDSNYDDEEELEENFEENDDEEEGEEDFETEEGKVSFFAKEMVMEGNHLNNVVGGEMEEFQRPSRCKEGEVLDNNKRLLNWETFCVAT